MTKAQQKQNEAFKIKSSPKKEPKVAPVLKKSSGKYNSHFLKLADLGYKNESVYYISELNTFNEVASYFTAQTLIGFSQISVEKEILVISLSTKELVVVLDLVLIPKPGLVYDLIRKLFTQPNLEVVTFAFSFDARILGKTINLNPKTMKNVIDLQENWGQSELEPRTDKPRMNQMISNFFNKSIDYAELSTDWVHRPLSNEKVVLAAMRSSARLAILENMEKKCKDLKLKYFDYVVPHWVSKQNNVRFNRNNF